MRARWIGIVCLVLSGCGSDEAERREDCDNIAADLREVAALDVELMDYEGLDRRGNPCAEPVPVTTANDFGPGCEVLRLCLADLE